MQMRKWRVARVDEYKGDRHDPEWYDVKAAYPDDAAESFIEEHESGECEYPIARDDGLAIVIVELVYGDPNDALFGKRLEYKVTGNCDPTYSADLLGEE